MCWRISSCSWVSFSVRPCSRRRPRRPDRDLFFDLRVDLERQADLLDDALDLAGLPSRL
jgi:hypothetical protein